MKEPSFQDHYPDQLARCYGCGRLNDQGLHLQSFWDGEESVCRYLPDSKYVAIPGYVYGGLLASLIDCHGTGTAAAAAYRAQGRPMHSEPTLRYVTASLRVDYLKPTPLGVWLEVRGKVRKIRGRTVEIEEWITANDEVTVRGELVAVRMPAKLILQLSDEKAPE